MMNMEALIILSNIDGVYDGDPALPGTKLITDITENDDASGGITDTRSSFGRGGMATKYRIATKVASEGTAVIIANGKRENVLIDLLTPDAPVPHTHLSPVAGSSLGTEKMDCP